MSIANWNSITQYLVGDQVYDGSANYYFAIANNINKNPPSAEWTLVAPPGSGVSSLNALTGALTLVGAGGTTITPGLPGAGDITIKSMPSQYNSFLATQSHLLPTATEFLVPFDSQSFSGTGVDLQGSPPTTFLGVSEAGVYRVLWSVQIDKTGGGGPDDFESYLKLNGTAVPDSASRSAINNNIEVIQTISVMLPLAPTDKLELACFTQTGTNVSILYVSPTPVVPAVPSVILDIERVA